MKRIIFLFLILLGAIGLGTLIVKDPGYVLIAYQYWTLETPLWFGIIIILLAFFSLKIVYHLICTLFGLPRVARLWNLKQQRRRSYADINQGVLQLAQGCWPTAEKYFKKAIPSKQFLLISYLAAAKAAQEQGAHARCDRYLQQAGKAFPRAQFAIDIVQAQGFIAREQFTQAVIALRHLHTQFNKHPLVLKLLYKVYVQLHDWQALQLLLVQLKRYKILSEQEYDRVELDIYCALLREAAQKHDESSLPHVWATFPRKIQKKPIVLADYVQYLLDRNAQQQAEDELFTVLKRHWDDRLIALYGLVTGSAPNKQLTRAEKWLSSHPDHAGLLLTLGRLCLHQQLWGKARSYLERSVALAPERENCWVLAELLEQLGERDLALKYYREASLKIRD